MNTCSNCQAQNKDQAQFCVNCGQPLTQVASPGHDPNGSGKMSGGQVQVGGDVAGRDKITTTTTGLDASTLVELTKQFAKIYQKIDARLEDPNTDKTEIKDTVQKIEEEVKKGEQANPAKVERWLKFLAGMADDIFQVVASTLASPIAGVAKAIQLIAKKAKT
ncbi:MAG: zinc ribbon domain-containing protein [Chloroflexi bacterium]|nr:zinc ribbon domain-containing protein [Chloroflexota bacterium]